MHKPLVHYWNKAVAPAVDSVPLQIITYVTALIVLSAAIHRFVEMPGVALSKKVFLPRRRAVVLPAKG